jgi:cytochrome bd-type quinol oxidase subunit 2
MTSTRFGGCGGGRRHLFYNTVAFTITIVLIMLVEEILMIVAAEATHQAANCLSAMVIEYRLRFYRLAISVHPPIDAPHLSITTTTTAAATTTATTIIIIIVVIVSKIHCP